MFNDLFNQEWYCDYCREPFKDNNPEKSTGWGMFHEECEAEGIAQAKREYEEAELEYQRQVKIQIKKDEKLLRKLRKRLSAKIMEWIDYEISEHGHHELGIKIVSQDKCKGERMKGKDYFGDDRCPIRTVYDDVSSDGYPCDDCYSGNVYIYIGKGQYFKLWVNG